MTVPAPKSLDELTLGAGIGLEDLVDREALGEMAASFFDLFAVPLRIYSETGALLTDATRQPELYAYLDTLKQGRLALQRVVSDVKELSPGAEGASSYSCFTGAAYRVTGIHYDGRRIGRMILGPFLPPSIKEVPQSLLAAAPEADPEKLRALLSRMPRAREETVSQISHHLAKTLDLILFSGHRALLTSSMHLATVKENFRELQTKNDQLQQAYDRLKELDRLKSNFLATVSHELRTPLTSIIGYSEMLLEGIAGDMATDQRDFVSTIHEKGEQLLELIKGLLDLSKLESGTMSLNKSSISAEKLLEDVIQTITPAALKKDVRVQLNVQPSLPPLWADPGRLRQVFVNLTENAVKFTPPGGSITLSAELVQMEAKGAEAEAGGLVIMSTRRPAVEFRVADTGIGIPEGERTRVFDAFYQVDGGSTRAQGGTGLGLSIVKRLVQGHDGQIFVQANAPNGAVFVVRVPLRRATGA